MSQIRITPSELREAAVFLGDRLESINGEVSQLKTKIDNVTAEWEGAAQSSFVVTFGEQMYPVLSDTLPQVITGIMSQLNAAANALEQADQAISDSFKMS